MVMAPPAMHDSAVSPCFRGCLAFLHRHFPPSPPSHPFCLPAVNSSPRPGIAPQSLKSSSQLLHLPGDLCHCLGYIWLRQGLSDSHSTKAPRVSCFTLSIKCFSSDSDNCPSVRISSRPAEGRSSPANTPVSPPSSFFLLSFEWV